eukprot:397099-Prorocentrum_minimum.AAC.2
MIVKEAVKRWNLPHGSFIEFVKATQPSDYRHRTRSDPALHTLQVLEQFVDSLQDADQLKMVERHWAQVLHEVGDELPSVLSGARPDKLDSSSSSLTFRIVDPSLKRKPTVTTC